MGRFEGAIDPKIRTFSQFAPWVEVTLTPTTDPDPDPNPNPHPNPNATLSLTLILTLTRYLWLLFADTAFVPLDRWVFNTEAHPLRVHDDYRWGEEWGSMPDVMPPSAAGAGAHAKDVELQEVRRRMRARAEALEAVAAQSRHVQE